MGRKYISLLVKNEIFLKFVRAIKLVIEQNISEKGIVFNDILHNCRQSEFRKGYH